MRLSGIRERHVDFAFSPLRETLRSIGVLLHPAKHAEQMPWVRAARKKLKPALRSELARFGFLFSPVAEIFPMLPGEIVDLRKHPAAYAEAVVRRLSGRALFEKHDVDQMLEPGWYRRAAAAYAQRHPETAAMLKEFTTSPARSLERFAAMLGAMDEEILQPVWGPIAQSLAEDIAMRRGVLRIHGITALLRTLSPELSAHHARTGSVVLEIGADTTEIKFGESSRLELSPSFFCWPHLQAYVVKESRGVRAHVSYPLPPLTARVASVPDRRGLAQRAGVLADETRLRVIELLHARDLSTRELSGYLRIAEPLVSRHLRAMLRAGIVERYRSGYFVMYRLRRDGIIAIVQALNVLT